MGFRLISLQFATMAAWTLTLGWLVVSDHYQLFLAPRFKFLVVAGGVMSLLFALGSLARPEPSAARNQLIKGAFLVLPILFILAAGDSTLDDFALSKRGLTPVQSNPSAPATAPATPDAGNLTPVEKPGKDAGSKTLPVPVAISDLIRSWEDWDGRAVQVEGLFSETVVNHDELSAVFRYFITCCAADAMPVGVFLDRPQASDLETNDWVRVTGRVRKTQMDGFEVIFMEEARLEKQPKPSKNAAYIFD